MEIYTAKKKGDLKHLMEYQTDNETWMNMDL